MKTIEIARLLLGHTRNLEFTTARNQLYADQVVSTEPNQPPLTGLPALAEKERYWRDTIETLHSVSFAEPLVAGAFFVTKFTWDITYKGQPRTTWDEVAVFKVRDGKVVSEQFFYETN